MTASWRLQQALASLISARARIDHEIPEPDDAPDVEAAEGDVIAMIHQTLRDAVAASDMAEMAKARAEAIKGRADRYKARAEALRGVAFAAMEVLELKKVELPDLTATMAKGQDTTIITDEAAIPPEYWRNPPPVIDKTALNADLKQGVVIPGAELANGMPRLTIRSK